MNQRWWGMRGGMTWLSEFERFELKVERPDGYEGCWIWVASRGPQGYGQAYDTNTGKPTTAHRVSYELFVGPVPDGLHLDHLCRNPPCVNPTHLEPVTAAENARRGAASRDTGFCKHGHGPEMRKWTAAGKRRCITCERAASRASKARMRARKVAGDGS